MVQFQQRESKCFQIPFVSFSLSACSIIESSNCEKLLGISMGSNLSFEYHVNRICRKASQKLHAFSRIAKSISEDKNRMLFKSFIISQFNIVQNCPIVWMCHGRCLNNKINNIHERAVG